jgi:hypothetical protein
VHIADCHRQLTKHLRRSYKITAEIDVPQGGGNGMLAYGGAGMDGFFNVLLNK